MADHASVGFWVRRFLSEHLVHERGVSRNTQQSYRDTFCLFLPYVAAQRKTAVDKLVIDDLSPRVVSDFLAHLEQARSCSIATRNQRLATLMLSLDIQGISQSRARGMVRRDSQHSIQTSMANASHLFGKRRNGRTSSGSRSEE